MEESDHIGVSDRTGHGGDRERRPDRDRPGPGKTKAVLSSLPSHRLHIRGGGRGAWVDRGGRRCPDIHNPRLEGPEGRSAGARHVRTVARRRDHRDDRGAGLLQYERRALSGADERDTSAVYKLWRLVPGNE